MKKILSLMLVLLMCLSAFVACDNSDASSSSSSSESKSESQSESASETAQGNLTIEDEHGTLHVIEIGNESVYDYYPVFKWIENPYSVYNVTIRREIAEPYETRIFSNYTAYSDFMNDIENEILKSLDPSSSEDEIPDIDESTFQNNFVIAVYQHKADCCRGKTYFYGNFEKEGTGYVLSYEQTVNPWMVEAVDEFSIDFVVIPKSACEDEIENITIDIKTIIHKYNTSVSVQ